MSSIMQIDPTRTSAADVLASVEQLVEREWQTPRDVLVDTFSKRNQYA
jgi:tRNA-dihydrouridine synthase C